jgi:fructose-1,6-bisphosphatase I
MLVYTTGQGVHGFTLDPTIGEFLLSHPNITMPDVGKYYSVNESNYARWSRGVQMAVRGFHGDTPDRINGKNSRYIGSFVADFHRTQNGGIFLIRPTRRIRVEAVPLCRSPIGLSPSRLVARLMGSADPGDRAGPLYQRYRQIGHGGRLIAVKRLGIRKFHARPSGA